jgi:hypothetical protein
MTGPRLPLGTRPARVYRAVKLRETNKFGAGLALIGDPTLNRIFNIAINKLSVNNLHRTNIDALRELIRARMRNATSSNNSALKNASIRAMTNYVAQRIGYKNRANSEQLYRLIIAIMEKGRHMNAATNNAQRRVIGEEIGNLLGSLVIKWNEVRVKDPSKKGFTPGFITGFLTPVIGANAAKRIVGTMPLINSARKQFERIKGVYSNPTMSRFNKFKQVVDPARAEAARRARQAATQRNTWHNAPEY